ncbi:protein kinase domain-containing protein [Lysobacter sp. F60174L2]|uniref:protein kinase domain-containing protein n=1 Tax=Lysobacter sp. F60174L2 TaxID=3459295 RepID=UPI00403DB77E
MDTERWQRLSPLLDELFELEPAARARRLHELRGHDADTARELEELIALEEGRESFLSEPVMSPNRGLLPGAEIGPYRLEHLLGEGGMGQVWLAARADGLYQRRVALKLLRPGLADTNLRLRFTRERQILARLAHPHIARLLDAGISSDGLPYLALEYVDGAPITDYSRDHQTPLETRLQMFQQICDAVSHAHANLIVHRDLKPSNILVTPAGEVRLLDFGIAKLLDHDAAPEQTRTGVRAFTLHYAAPEQVRGEPVTTMTDVYSLGVVLYELLVDAKPYRPSRDSDAAWEEAILTQDPARPSLALLRAAGGDATGHARRPPHGHDAAARARRARTLAGDLDNIVLKALSKRPEQRYPSVEALAQDLQRYAAGRPVHARAQSWNYRVGKYLRRHRWALATGILTTLVLTASLGVVAWQAREALHEAARAQAMQDFMVGVFEGASGSRDGQPLDLRQLLSTAAERGERELARQPRALAEMLGVIARLRTGLGDYIEAKTLLDRQALLIAGSDASDTPASLRLESLTQRGRVLRLLGDATTCIELMQPALDRASHEQALLTPQVTEFYSQLGRCRRANGERQGARQLFERSLALRRESRADRVGEVENLMDLAGLHADVGETRIALADFEGARARLRREAGDRHPLLVDIHRNLSRLHRALGDLDQAETELDNAMAVTLEVNGSGHAATLAVMRQLAAIHLDQGRYADAENELRDIHRRLVARFGPHHVEVADSYLDLGVVAWERGALESSLDSLRQALRIRRGTGAPAAIAAALFQQAAVLHASGRDGPAHPLLLEARELLAPSDHPDAGAPSLQMGKVERLLGEVEIGLGRSADGVTRLERATAMLRTAYGDDHPATRQAELVLAHQRALPGAGTALGAAALAQLDALAGLSDGDIELRKVAWLARAYAAQLRCHGPQRPQALQQLQQLDTRLRQARPEGGALSRDVAAIRTGCGLRPVDRALAAD